MKASLWSSLAAGYTPVGPFEIPVASDVKREAAEKVKQAERPRAVREEPKRVADSFGQDWEDGGQQSQGSKGGEIVSNHKSWGTHGPHPDDGSRTVCPYVEKMAEHYERTNEETANLTMYQRCPACFREGTRIALPEWEQEECDEPSTDTSSSTGSYSSVESLE